MSFLPLMRRSIPAAGSRPLRQYSYRATSMALLMGFFGLVTSNSAPAIVKRHDVSDFKYRELGERYRQTIVEGIVAGKGGPMLGNGVGALVAPEWVLTAAHVAAPMTSQGETKGAKPHNVSINGLWYPIQKVYLHPEWTENGSPQDIALIRLREPVPGAIPACLYPGKNEVGQVAVLVGTGGTGDGVTGVRKGDGKLRGATVRIGSIEKAGMLLSWNFKTPGQAGVTALEGISGPGDSGGPAFVLHKGRHCVAGVSSGQERNGRTKSGQYGVSEFYSRVSFFRPWIKKIMAEGGSAKPPGV